VTPPTRWNHLKHAAVRRVAQAAARQHRDGAVGGLGIPAQRSTRWPRCSATPDAPARHHPPRSTSGRRGANKGCRLGDIDDPWPIRESATERLTGVGEWRAPRPLRVVRSLRGDQIGRMHARHQIDDAQFHAGRADQQLIEKAGITGTATGRRCRPPRSGRPSEGPRARSTRAGRVTAHAVRAGEGGAASWSCVYERARG
jgi:hypothetical protein